MNDIEWRLELKATIRGLVEKLTGSYKIDESILSGSGGSQFDAKLLQNRDRSRDGYVLQMKKIADNPDYDRVSTSKTPDTGAPMVFVRNSNIPTSNAGKPETITMSDGKGGTIKVPSVYAVVEANSTMASHNSDGSKNKKYGGETGIMALNNGRTAALKKAYNQGTAEEYKKALKSDSSHGISSKAIDSMKNPMLVRVFSESAIAHLEDPGTASNVSAGATLAASEQAESDARRIDTNILSLYQDGDIDSAANRDFVRAFMKSVGDSEEMATKDGSLSSSGASRINGALIAKAYKDTDILTDLTENTNDELKSIGKVLTEVAGKWSLMAEAANDGYIDSSMDITTSLTTAITLIRKARQSKKSMFDLVSQSDLLDGAVDPVTKALLNLIYKGVNYDRVRSAAVIKKALLLFIDRAMATSPGAELFGETVKPEEMLTAENKAIEEGEKDKQAQGALFDSIAEHFKSFIPVFDDLAVAARMTDIRLSDSQKESGRYRKGRTSVHGLRVAIESPKGTIRSGTSKATGKRWANTMNAHYGYFESTIGADGDEVDAYFGPGAEEENPGIYVVNQHHGNGRFDEHKVMFGYDSKESARKAYLGNYHKDWNGLGSIKKRSLESFKKWLHSKNTQKIMDSLPGVNMSKSVFDSSDEKVLSLRTIIKEALASLENSQDIEERISKKQDIKMAIAELTTLKPVTDWESNAAVAAIKQAMEAQNTNTQPVSMGSAGSIRSVNHNPYGISASLGTRAAVDNYVKAAGDNITIGDIDSIVSFMEVQIDKYDGLSGLPRDYAKNYITTLLEKKARLEGIEDLEITEDDISLYHESYGDADVFLKTSPHKFSNYVSARVFTDRISEVVGKRRLSAYQETAPHTEGMKLFESLQGFGFSYKESENQNGIYYAYKDIGASKVLVSVEEHGKKYLQEKKEGFVTIDAYYSGDSEQIDTHLTIEHKVGDSTAAPAGKINEFTNKFKTIVDTSNTPEFDSAERIGDGGGKGVAKALRARFKKSAKDGEVPKDLKLSIKSDYSSVAIRVTHYPDSMKMHSEDYLKWADEGYQHDKNLPVYRQRTDDHSALLRYLEDHANAYKGEFEYLTVSIDTDEKKRVRDLELAAFKEANESDGIELGYGRFGNGTVVWNSNKEVNGDYQKVAHISDNYKNVEFKIDLNERRKNEIIEYAGEQYRAKVDEQIESLKKYNKRITDKEIPIDTPTYLRYRREIIDGIESKYGLSTSEILRKAGDSLGYGFSESDYEGLGKLSFEELINQVGDNATSSDYDPRLVKDHIDRVVNDNDGLHGIEWAVKDDIPFVFTIKADGSDISGEMYSDSKVLLERDGKRIKNIVSNDFDGIEQALVNAAMAVSSEPEKEYREEIKQEAEPDNLAIQVEALRTLPIDEYEERIDSLIEEIESAGRLEEFESLLGEIDESRDEELKSQND